MSRLVVSWMWHFGGMCYLLASSGWKRQHIIPELCYESSKLYSTHDFAQRQWVNFIVNGEEMCKGLLILYVTFPFRHRSLSIDTDNRKLLLICILLLLHSLISLSSFFNKNTVVIYVFLLEEAMHSYCCLCILIVSICILIVVYVFLYAATLTEVFPCFFLSCKANARV